MEALKSDYFDAICLLVRNDRFYADFGLQDFGLSPGLCVAIRWYIEGPSYYQDIIRKTLIKEVMDARRGKSMVNTNEMFGTIESTPYERFRS